MPWTRAAFAVLVFTAVATAAPREKSHSPEALAAGEQFARQVGAAAAIVAREYVRPIATNVLYAAAVEALFETARRPRPDIVLRNLKAAKSETECLDILKEARASVHGIPELADNRDLIAAVTAFTPVLDPHTVLMTNAAFTGTATAEAYGFDFEGEARTPRAARGTFGRGVDIAPEGEIDGSTIPQLPFRVLTVKPGSPAQRAGLRPGDMIRQIDGIAANVSTANKAFASLHGAGPNKADPGLHHLVVDRAGSPDLRLRLEPPRASQSSRSSASRRGPTIPGTTGSIAIAALLTSASGRSKPIPATSFPNSSTTSVMSAAWSSTCAGVPAATSTRQRKSPASFCKREPSPR